MENSERTPNDSNLIKNSLKSPREFFHIFEKYYQNIFRYVSYRVYNQQDREDLVSETFINVYKNLSRYDETKSTFKNWIYTIAKRKIIDYHRAKKRKGDKNVRLDEIPDNFGDTPESSFELYQEIGSALDCMSYKYSEVLRLRYLDQLSVKEISALLKISESNVYKREERALKLIGKLINRTPKKS